MSTNNHSFQIDLPNDWSDKTIFTYHGPHDSGLQHNLIITIDPNVPKNTDIKQYAHQQLGETIHYLPGFEMVKETEKILPSGRIVYEITYRYTPSDLQVLFQKQYYLIQNSMAYIFTSTFTKQTLKTIATVVDEIIDSFKLSTDFQ